jgi:hypothetical protein
MMISDDVFNGINKKHFNFFGCAPPPPLPPPPAPSSPVTSSRVKGHPASGSGHPASGSGHPASGSRVIQPQGQSSNARVRSSNARVRSSNVRVRGHPAPGSGHPITWGQGSSSLRVRSSNHLGWGSSSLRVIQPTQPTPPAAHYLNTSPIHHLSRFQETSDIQ